MRLQPGEDGDHVTFCRLCEAFCGMVATVEDGRVTRVRPDRDNPHSRGHVCVKGTAITAVTYDPDRVLTPLRRCAGGGFEAVGWDEAVDDVAARLATIREESGGEAIAAYLGNPTGYSSRAFGAFGGFMAALGSRKMYGAGSQDSNARLTANYMVHGGPHYTTVPDLPRCDFLLMLGANPLVSNGWMVFNPRWRHDLDAIAARGGVVVVDPRRTETARAYEHLAIRPDGDAWLLVGVLRTLFAEGLVDRAAAAAVGDGLAELEAAVARVPDDAVAAHTGLSTDTVAALARRFAGTPRAAVYGAGSQDSNARLTANYMIHGGPHYTTVPDLPRCDFLLMLGANPLVSNGWMVFNPRWRHDLDAIAARGGVVVVDPRRTETARTYEHLAIRPDGDAWLLVGMLRTLFAEGLIDRAAAAAVGDGLIELEAAIARVPDDAVAAHTGLSTDTVAALARRFAGTPRAAVYGALGLCRGRFGTLGAYLASVLNAVTARYGAPGGVRFGHELLPARGGRVGGHGEKRTRIGGIPTIANKMATAMLPADIEEDGPGRVRALICSAGNPAVSAPGGAALERALGKLDLHVSLDLYVTETNRHADYILPAVTFLERGDWPMIGLHVAVRPFLQYAPPVVAPLGEAREDYAIYQAIARAMGLDGPGEGRRLPPDPDEALDRALRSGPYGDHFGERPEGWSRARLLEHPHGVLLAPVDDGGDWRSRIGYPDGQLRLWHELAVGEVERLLATPPPAADGLRLVGRRDLRSINSWMHNVERLIRGQKPNLHIHPDDAARHGIVDGAAVRVASAAGAIETVAHLTDAMAPGSVSYPHGWGHRGGWRQANAAPGSNSNALHGLGEAFVERVSGMSLIDCLDVEVTPLDQPARQTTG